MQYNVSFFEKTGYKVVNKEKELDYPDYIMEELVDLEYLVARKSHTVTRKLRAAIKKYPRIPEFLELLLEHYYIRKEGSNVEKVINALGERFPNNISSKMHRADFYGLSKRWEDLDAFLGETRDIRNFIDQELIFEIDFMDYYEIAMRYDLEHMNEERAEQFHRLLYKLKPFDIRVIDLGKELFRLRFQKKMFSRLEPVLVESFPTAKYELTDKMPQFNHKQIHALYNYNEYKLPQKTVEEILALPRETLVEDLTEVLADGIRRTQSFYDSGDFIEKEQSFITHALFLLGGLQAEEQLPKVLDVFRQGEAFLDYWFGDYLEINTIPVVFSLAKDQLGVLKAYVKEPNQCCMGKLVSAKVVSLVGLHFPERRQEALDWFEEVFTYYLENIEDENIIDSIFISLAVSYYSELRSAALVPLVKVFDEKELFDHQVNGDIDELIRIVDLPFDPSDIEPMPQTAWEFFSRAYTERKQPSNQDFSIENNEYEKYFEDTVVKSLFQEIMYKPEAAKSNVATKSPVIPKGKIGRNEPCYCGSGKKYKKCCL